QNCKLGLCVAHDPHQMGCRIAARNAGGLILWHAIARSQAEHSHHRDELSPQRGLMANIGERSGCVVTTPTGMTGLLSTSSTRNVPISLASASVASTCAKCAPMQIRGPAPNGR